MHKKQGFTLVELMIAIAVMLILATITIVTYSAVQKSSRDNQRQAKVTAIADALEKYYEQNGEYPSCLQLQQSPATVVANTLPTLEEDVFRMPLVEGGITEAVKCPDYFWSVSNYSDIYYYGDTSTACKTNNPIMSKGCGAWHLAVGREDGDVVQLRSRRGYF